MQGDLDEVLDGLHALELVGLPRHLGGHPEGLVVDGLLEALEAGRAGLGAQLEQVLDVLGGLDGAEELEGPHGELRSDLHRAELQQGDLALAQEVLGVLVRAQSLCLHVALQVVSNERAREVRVFFFFFIKNQLHSSETRKNVSSPATQLNPVSQFGKLVWQPPLFDDALWRDGHFTQRVGIRRRRQGKLPNGLSDHLLGRGVLADHDVPRLLVRLEDSQNLV